MRVSCLQAANPWSLRPSPPAPSDSACVRRRILRRSPSRARRFWLREEALGLGRETRRHCVPRHLTRQGVQILYHPASLPRCIGDARMRLAETTRTEEDEMGKVQMNVRVDEALKRAVDECCRSRGFVVSHFVREALLDRLQTPGHYSLTPIQGIYTTGSGRYWAILLEPSCWPASRRRLKSDPRGASLSHTSRQRAALSLMLFLYGNPIWKYGSSPDSESRRLGLRSEMMPPAVAAHRSGTGCPPPALTAATTPATPPCSAGPARPPPRAACPPDRACGGGARRSVPRWCPGSPAGRS